MTTSARVYDVRSVAREPHGADQALLEPHDAAVRHRWLRDIASDAYIYGLPLVHQYFVLHDLALDSEGDQYVGFDRFLHETDRAGPGYRPFRTPNADTLYSHAWIDLSNGPVELHIPPMGDRYFTAHLLDAFGESVNLSTRTLGTEGGTVWLALPEWAGECELPEGVALTTLASPYMWLLLRVFVRDDADLPMARRCQESVRLRRTTPRAGAGHWLPVTGDAGDLDPLGFLRVLDFCLRRQGYPVQDEALVARFTVLGVAGPESFDRGARSEDDLAAVRAGFSDAEALVRDAVLRRGFTAAGGWRTLDSGTYGHDHLQRAATCFVGLGATVRAESGAYTTFVDGRGERLDGSRDLVLVLAPPPPVDAFWSVSAYDADGRDLVTNELGRYSVNSHTPGLVVDTDGSVRVELTSTAPSDAPANVLPVPPGHYYLVVRAYLGHRAVVDGTWTPAPVQTARERSRDDHIDTAEER